MRAFKKGNCPDFLEKKWQEWGQRYAANRAATPNHKFQWPTHEGVRINQSLEPLLGNDTQTHCSYCDNFPIREQEDSIDHFKPKSIPAFYELVCHWHNLYYCCENCQKSRWEVYDDLLLRPDAADYSFDSYFVYNFQTNKLDISPAADDIAKLRAIYTIDKFGLNSPKSADSRRISYERFENAKLAGKDIVIDDYAFRFMFD